MKLMSLSIQPELASVEQFIADEHCHEILILMFAVFLIEQRMEPIKRWVGGNLHQKVNVN